MQYAEMFKEYLNEQAEYMDEIRSIKHDMQAHFIVLQYYLKEEKYENAKSYLEGMMSSPKLWSPPHIDVGHEMINAVIAYSLKRSKNPVEFRHIGLIPENIEIEDMDLCTVFSNLLSNSVEACDKLEHSVRGVTLEIHESGNDLVIIIENPIETATEAGLLGRGTTKEDTRAHGYGISNSKKVIEKYNGKMEFEITESLFRVKVLFSEVVKSSSIC